jgi:hypothetical protein
MNLKYFMLIEGAVDKKNIFVSDLHSLSELEVRVNDVNAKKTMSKVY